MIDNLHFQRTATLSGKFPGRISASSSTICFSQAEEIKTWVWKGRGSRSELRLKNGFDTPLNLHGFLQVGLPQNSFN
jgi:hypothetical protein